MGTNLTSTDFSFGFVFVVFLLKWQIASWVCLVLLVANLLLIFLPFLLPRSFEAPTFVSLCCGGSLMEGDDKMTR